MAIFKWYKKYSVNNNELDAHHKNLFVIFNRLYGNCLKQDNANCIDPILEELVSYANYHFTAEEHHMRNVGYKEIDKHILEHRSFTQKTLQLQDVANKDEAQATRELILYLRNWLLNHIIKEDKKFSI